MVLLKSRRKKEGGGPEPFPVFKAQREGNPRGEHLPRDDDPRVQSGTTQLLKARHKDDP